MNISHFKNAINTEGNILYSKGSFAAGKRLYNAIGTSGAKVKINGTWYKPIDAWREVFGEEHEPIGCPNEIEYCVAVNGNGDCTDLVGAHVVEKDPDGKDIQIGDTYYIIPLCASCNDGKENTIIKLESSVKALKLTWKGNEIRD